MAGSQRQFEYAYIADLLRLDPETGLLYWRKSGRGRPIAKAAGSKDRRGYITLTIDYVRVRAHNLVWLLTTGQWPAGEIDHINHNPADNRPSNLRDVTASENNFNRKCVNPYGVPGVFKLKGKYRAMHNTTLLGYFNTAEEAVAARRQAEAR